jgi:heme A synthase
MNWTHMTVGSVLFVLQLAVVWWLWWSRHRTPTALALLVVQVVAGVVCFVSVLDLAAAMLYGQLVFQAAFTASAVAGLGAELRRRDLRGPLPPARARVRRR